MKFKFKKLNPDVADLKYAKPGDAAMDVRAYSFERKRASDGQIIPITMINNAYEIQPGETVLVGTGIKVQGIETGYKICVVARSGTALNGLIIANAPGTVDEQYRGEIKGIVHNISDRPISLAYGDRFAQIYPEKVELLECVETLEEEASERGAGGFNSTGVK